MSGPSAERVRGAWEGQGKSSRGAWEGQGKSSRAARRARKAAAMAADPVGSMLRRARQGFELFERLDPGPAGPARGPLVAEIVKDIQSGATMTPPGGRTMRRAAPPALVGCSLAQAAAAGAFLDLVERVAAPGGGGTFSDKISSPGVSDGGAVTRCAVAGRLDRARRLLRGLALDPADLWAIQAEAAARCFAVDRAARKVAGRVGDARARQAAEAELDAARAATLAGMRGRAIGVEGLLCAALAGLSLAEILAARRWTPGAGTLEGRLAAELRAALDRLSEGFGFG